MYTPSEKDKKNIENNFKYHAPKPASKGSFQGDDQDFVAQADRYEAIRAKAKEFAELLVTLCPPSRELSVSLTELETSVMWANASIARNE